VICQILRNIAEVLESALRIEHTVEHKRTGTFMVGSTINGPGVSGPDALTVCFIIEKRSAADVLAPRSGPGGGVHGGHFR
jgi:hypothetical protein